MVLANALVLQDAFRESGYTDLLAGFDLSKSEAIASEYGFHPEDFFESDQKPDALLGLFISKERDDLFLLLDGDSMAVSDLCDEWDKRIRVFTVMNRRSKAVEKLQYNIVQLVVYSGEKDYRTIESKLLMSRKIIIRGNLDNKERIEISDDKAVELPFRMIPANAFAPDQEQTQRLHQLIPEDGELLTIMKTPHERVNRRRSMKEQPKYYSALDFDKIKEWLEK